MECTGSHTEPRTITSTVPDRLAPSPEQERIVTAIEEAFSKLDAGEAGLRTVRQRLKRMREAVLAAAVTGRLVPQDPTDTPARELLADLGVEPVESTMDCPSVGPVPRVDALAAAGEKDRVRRTPTGWRYCWRRSNDPCHRPCGCEP